MGSVKQQFFPTSDRPEVLVEVRLRKERVSIRRLPRLRSWRLAAEATGDEDRHQLRRAGSTRFFFAMSPELPDPAFAKLVVLTPNAEAREALKVRLREAVSSGLAPEAFVRVTQLVFGPFTPFPVEFRIMGPDPEKLYEISEQAISLMQTVPDVRHPIVTGATERQFCASFRTRSVLI